MYLVANQVQEQLLTNRFVRRLHSDSLSVGQDL
jgi:hypothetical protein